MAVDTSRNRYCGPYAVAHVCGLNSSADGSRLIRQVTGRRQIQSASAWSVVRAIELGGGGRFFQRGRPKRADRPTLAQWLKGRRGGLYVVHVTGHFVVVDGWRIYDNTHAQGTARKDWPHRRKRVIEWFRFR